MKNVLKVFGLIAIVAIIGLSMLACDDDPPPSSNNPGGGTNPGGGNNPGSSSGSGLVGKWYASQAMADAGDTPLFEFTSNGKYIPAGMDIGATYTTASNTFSVYYRGEFQLKYNYSISGTVLTCDCPEQPYAQMVGTWYKPRR